MKTLKQIREEYDNNVLSLVENLPEEMVLEGHNDKLSMSSPIPSAKQMPVLLVFRRMQYRVFPKGQVVALYYSNMLNKYLSIPFGPDGNLNLSESVIIDDLNEDWQDVNRKDKTDGLSQKAVNAYRRENPGSKLQTAVTEKNPKGKRASRRKSFCSRMGGMKKRLTSAKTARDPDSRINKALRRWNCEEDFKLKLNQLREERLEENPLASLARGAVSWAAKKALGAVGGAVANALTGGSDNQPTASEKMDAEAKARTGTKKGIQIKKGTSWKKTSPDIATATRQSKLASADLASARQVGSPQKQIQENKMSDLRIMIKEGIDAMDININGRPIRLNTSMAKRILEVYDSVNTKNKKIVEGMLNENLESFKKLLNFSIRN
jgi:hypothetical protein